MKILQEGISYTGRLIMRAIYDGLVFVGRVVSSVIGIDRVDNTRDKILIILQCTVFLTSSFVHSILLQSKPPDDYQSYESFMTDGFFKNEYIHSVQRWIALLHDTPFSVQANRDEAKVSLGLAEETFEASKKLMEERKWPSTEVMTNTSNLNEFIRIFGETFEAQSDYVKKRNSTLG